VLTGWIAVLVIRIIILLDGVLSLVGGGSDSSSYTPVSAKTAGRQMQPSAFYI